MQRLSTRHGEREVCGYCGREQPAGVWRERYEPCAGRGAGPRDDRRHDTLSAGRRHVGAGGCEQLDERNELEWIVDDVGGPINLPKRASLLGEYLLTEGAGAVAHDTSGNGNDGAISGATWDGTADLNFTGKEGNVQLPTALNAAQAWQFALYLPPFGSGADPQAPGTGRAGRDAELSVDSVRDGSCASLPAGELFAAVEMADALRCVQHGRHGKRRSADGWLACVLRCCAEAT